MGPAPGGGGTELCVVVPPPPLAARETAAKATAVIPAASSDKPRGPKRIVMDLFFFISTPLVRLLEGIKPAAAERRLRSA
jgi:hypothetical protein